MHRSHLLQLLQNYKPAEYSQQSLKERIELFVKENPNCFERTLIHGHITASSWLLNKNNTAFLLTHHAKLNMWVQLGGHCDGESNVLTVAIKEAQEESGINAIQAMSSEIFDIDIHLIPETKREPAHYHYDIRFLLQVISDEPLAISHESKDLKWFSDNLPTQEASVLRMYHKWKKLNELEKVKIR